MELKTTFICTTLNEGKTINKLLDSIFLQTKLPNEIIIVDGGSTDNTVNELKNEKIKKKSYRGEFKILIKKGNRSMGRNEAIRNATNEIIICSDAGCMLDKNWIKNITAPFIDSNIDVVAGYYKGNAKTVFQKCLIPYVLVMENRINYDNFLPATRSIAFKKYIWKKVGGFPNEFSYNEDYVFAKKLKKINANIKFQKKAIVYWIPKESIIEAFNMFFRFSYGDSEAFIFRPKVIFLFFRYLVGILLLLIYFFTKSLFVFLILLSIFIIYLIWSIVKNYQFVNDLRAIFILPLLQIISDIAVLLGTFFGLISRKSY